MHKGFILRKLTIEELRHKRIYIPPKHRVIFPKPNTLFFIESYDEHYTVVLTNRGFIDGLEEWFNGFPIKKDDIVIIFKHAKGYSILDTSPIVKSQMKLILEMRRIQLLTDKDILCPNCYFSLEEIPLEKNSHHLLKLKCSRCGFILVKTQLT